MVKGKKHDKGKPQLSLVYYSFLKEVANVRRFGNDKYIDPENWRHVDNKEKRYLDACLRHVFSYISGEKNDPESGFNHLAHAACCIMFLIEGEKND